MGIIRLTITGTLVLDGALHIGSGGGGLAGERATITDAAVVRDSQGRPYIPGSSLRGTLRAAVEQLAPLLVAMAGSVRDEDAIEQLQRAFQQGDLTEEALEQRLSAIERLFGTTLWASPLRIPDLPLRSGSGAGEVRHGVGIDRDTGAARDGVKYDFEVLPKGLEFSFWLRCELPEYQQTTQAQLLAIGLQLLQQGELTLGGRAARGVGTVKLTNMQVYRLDLADRTAVLAALTATSETGRYGAATTTWLDDTLKGL